MAAAFPEASRWRRPRAAPPKKEKEEAEAEDRGRWRRRSPAGRHERGRAVPRRLLPLPLRPPSLSRSPSFPLLLPRGYQVRAAGWALAANTLLCLPTGLGKTRVAAAVLFNFARWFPRGKALFLAPTRPLVAQQRKACAGLLPQRHTARLTAAAAAHGGTQIADRKEIWRTKRVFFLTPQIMVNDLSRGICPAAEVKCLVIDEAHKALGNHAYCQVVKELCKYTKDFRILALTATPGSNTKAVQQVISNLLISHIEVCSEDSPEIQPYSHERQVEKCVIPLGKELGDVQAAYIQVLEAFAGRLVRLRVLSQREIPSLTKYQIILARDQFRKNPPSHLGGMQPGAIEGDFALCIRLYHGYELLLQMGMRSLYLFLSGIMDGSKGMTRAKNELARNEDFMKLYSQLENMFSDTAVTSVDGSHPNIGTRNGKLFIYSHPKLKKLEEVVTEHFRSWKERGDQEAPGGRLADTRVMIFSSFRDSVQEIAEMLNRHFPAVRAMTFVGHSSGKSTKGFTQKEQLEVRGGEISPFATGAPQGPSFDQAALMKYLPGKALSVVEAGKICSCTKEDQWNPTEALLLLQTYDQSQCNSRNLLKALSENKGLRLYQHSPRVIPEGVNPQTHRLLIIPEEEEPGGGPSRGRGGHSHRQKGRPYSTSSPGAEPPSLSKSWCLTVEEFGRWDRLYRMKAGDGIRKIAMPPSHFETLKEEEEEEKQQQAPPDPETLELSLTEWTLWQSRPFPTSLVDHSDRCRLFIDVMGMIEQMRQEEGDCSYEQKMKPSLHWEDVDASPPPPQRGKSGPNAMVPQKPSVPKRPLVDLASEAKRMSLPTEEELDAESVSLFKATSFKPARRPPVTSGGATGQADLSPRPECFSASGLPAVESSGPKRWPDENQEHKDNSLGGSPCRGGSASPERAKPRGLQPVLEPSGLSVDSGPSGSAEDVSPLPSSSLFYFPASEADPLGPSGAKADEDPSWRNHILTTTRHLLSQSPSAGGDDAGLGGKEWKRRPAARGPGKPCVRCACGTRDRQGPRPPTPGPS
ncbi:hypothetical protein JRQ81_001298 [Phrynocephalus forsythii]|uniref:ATP-dependent RNA helicase FANCM n=1 Tax=Phrynocephalus forsythii TaxID=171643 RepID=A0A9Q1B7R3_9SAUR|nr:hypothetical protein JRQ81_001298 [Phrynocephalus forsythii]